jgi:hypothetical protein
MDGFKRHKTGSGYPNFKEKDGEQSCRFNNYVTNTKNKDETIRVDFKNHKVLLPTLDRDDNASINIICISKCPDKEEEEDIKKVKSCKKVASAGSTHSGCRRTSDSKLNEASNHTIPVDPSTGVI